MGLPIDDDYLYETFCIAKPENYDQLKAQKEAERAAMREALNQSQGNDEDKDDNKKPNEPKQPSNTVQKALKNRLRGFFGLAPDKGADTDF